MKYWPLVFLSFCSCSLTPKAPSLPSVPSLGGSQSATPPSTQVTAVLAESTDQIWRWVLICTVLVFVFPSLRQPIVGFLTAFFGFISLPFSLGQRFVKMKYNSKFGNGKK